MPHTSPGFIFGSSSAPSSSQCFRFTFRCLVYLGHYWTGFSRRGDWKVGVMLWALAWTDQSSPCPSSPFCGSGDTTGLAREEPPLAGALRRPPGDNGEHPRHCHPLLHGHEGMCPAWAPSLRAGPPVLCGTPSVTAGAGSTCQPRAGGSASKPSTYGAGLSSLLAMADTRTRAGKPLCPRRSLPCSRLTLPSLLAQSEPRLWRIYTYLFKLV